jgi:hypothetical protein
MRTEAIEHFKFSKDPTGKRTYNLPSCGAVPQPTILLLPVTQALHTVTIVSVKVKVQTVSKYF